MAPRDRGAGRSEDRVVDNPEGSSCLPLSLSSSSVNDTKRRGRDRTVEVDLREALVPFVPGLRVSAKLVLELIPDDDNHDYIRGKRMSSALLGKETLGE